MQIDYRRQIPWSNSSRGVAANPLVEVGELRPFLNERFHRTLDASLCVSHRVSSRASLNRGGGSRWVN